MMPMHHARVVALLIVEGGVGGDSEERDVTVTQKRHMMKRSPTEFGFNFCCQFDFNLLSNSLF
jgi:hypothetical protein